MARPTSWGIRRRGTSSAATATSMPRFSTCWASTIARTRSRTKAATNRWSGSIRLAFSRTCWHSGGPMRFDRWLIPSLVVCAAGLVAQDAFDRDSYARDHVRFLVAQLDQWTKEFPQEFNTALM